MTPVTEKIQLGKVNNDFTFHFIFVVDPYGIWTLLKMVLPPQNVNRYRLFKS
jgi:hypothetical protein